MMYIKELRVRYRLRRVAGLSAPGGPVSTPTDAASFLIPLLTHEVVEVAGLLCLSTKHTLIAYHELARGTIDSTPMHPREVFKAALLSNAASIVIGHNHPSDDVTPSQDDRDLTMRLSAAGTLIGIELLDHLILAATGRYYSFREAGQL
jgi:DNA repair protein RadC